jgi:hypothetical protein
MNWLWVQRLPTARNAGCLRWGASVDKHLASLRRRIVGREGAFDPQVFECDVARCAKCHDRREESVLGIVLTEDHRQQEWGAAFRSRICHFHERHLTQRPIALRPGTFRCRRFPREVDHEQSCDSAMHAFPIDFADARPGALGARAF